MVKIGKLLTGAARRLSAGASALGHLALGFALLLGPRLALATQGGGQNPGFNLDSLLPSDLKTKPFTVQIITLLLIFGIAGLFVMMAFGGMSGVADIFTAMSESRQRGEWGSFVKTIAFAVVVFIVAAVIAGTLIGWFSNLTINPKITIGGSTS